MYYVNYTNSLENIKPDKPLNEVNVNSIKRLYNATIEQAINAIHTFNFTINTLHPEYKNIKEKITRVTIFHYFKDKKITDFNGYILKIQEFMDAKGAIYKQVVCENALGYFYDSVQTFWEYTGTLQDYLAYLTSIHNASVENFKRLGYTGINVFSKEQETKQKYVFQYGKSYACVDYILSRFGGEFRVEYDRFLVNVLIYHYDKFVPSTAYKNPIIKLAHNLQSMDTFIDGSQIITRLYPYGAKIKGEDGKDTEKRVSIKSANYGEDFIIDPTAQSIYGTICGTVFFDEYNDPAALKIRAQIYLNEINNVKKSYKITALDLSTIGIDLAEFELGSEYHLVNEIMDIDTRKNNVPLRIIKKTVDINEPHKSNIEIGERLQSISSISAEMANTLKYKLPEQQEKTLSEARSVAKDTADKAMMDAVKYEDTPELLAPYAKLTDLNAYSTTAQINQILSNYATNANVDTKLANYDKKTDNIDGSRVKGTLDSVNLTTNIITLSGYDLAQKIADIESRLSK
ncbi:hypothetical protein FACS1894132_05790 [Clostridia bacterium]|nr:hypothetical protein FACS1894132_05790 [Clostridia bacterium]